MNRPVITLTISGPDGKGKSLLGHALCDVLLMLGATSVANDEMPPGDWRKHLHELLGEADVRIVTQEGP